MRPCCLEYRDEDTRVLELDSEIPGTIWDHAKLKYVVVHVGSNGVSELPHFHLRHNSYSLLQGGSFQLLAELSQSVATTR